jgi:HlyD family secretion protein
MKADETNSEVKADELKTETKAAEPVKETTPPVSVTPTGPVAPATPPAATAGATPATPAATVPPVAHVEKAAAAKPSVGPAKPAAPATTVAPELQAKPDHAVSQPVRKGFRNPIIFTLSIIGIIAGLIAAYIFGLERKAQPPVFKPVSSPFDSAIYANGIIESDQPSGENINIYPDVSGPITQVLVREGQQVSAGSPLFTIDDSVQRANTELAAANLKAAQDQYDKRRASYDLDSKSISKDALDTAEDAVIQDTAALKAANALLQKYSVKAMVDGVVLAVSATTGSYVSAQGTYDTYTEGFDPLVVMCGPQDHLGVRCYVDEILVSRLPSAWHIQAQMSVRGTDVKVPLEFVRVQPYVSPKIELSNQRQEKVDLRVLPVIFRFEKKDAPVYPGQLVDVYIGQK